LTISYFHGANATRSKARPFEYLDLEPENEEYKALEATANLAQDPDDAAIDRAIELEIGHLPDDERELLRDKVRGRLNRPLARRY
jgi:hypothetical protein